MAEQKQIKAPTLTGCSREDIVVANTKVVYRNPKKTTIEVGKSKTSTACERRHNIEATRASQMGDGNEAEDNKQSSNQQCKARRAQPDPHRFRRNANANTGGVRLARKACAQDEMACKQPFLNTAALAVPLLEPREVHPRNDLVALELPFLP